MANSSPDRRHIATLIVACTMATAAANVMAEEGELPTIQRGVPITIDARSSEYNYSSNQLAFEGLRLDQGTLGVQADHAETDKLDFEDGVWIFRGNVVVEADNAVLYCDEARLTFAAHQLAEAELRGAPAVFRQTVVVPDQPTKVNSGEANLITYRLEQSLLELREDARFSDGTNSISGDMITYDLQAQNLRVGSGDSGPVKITIDPSRLQQEYEKDP